MKKFMVLYKGPATRPGASHEGWPEWFRKLGGALVDVGSPTINKVSVASTGSSNVSTLDINGYSVIQADDEEAARGLVLDHPYFALGSEYTIEVWELPKK
jgi:hypothetical protein